MKKNVLFICTQNSARSQMAEAMLRHLKGDEHDVYSAGTDPTFVHPGAIEALNEAGIDTARLRSKSALEYLGRDFDLVVTVCDRAKEKCPFFPGAKETEHSGFTDPADLVSQGMSEQDAFAEVRDRIRRWIEERF